MSLKRNMTGFFAFVETMSARIYLLPHCVFMLSIFLFYSMACQRRRTILAKSQSAWRILNGKQRAKEEEGEEEEIPYID